MTKSFILITTALLSACTGHLYIARTTFQDGDQRCEALAYWSRTDYIIGVKADSVLTVTAGGNRRAIQYTEQDNRIVYRGEKSRDQKVYGSTTTETTFVCGWVDKPGTLQDFSGKELVLYMHCRAKADEFTISKGYLPAQASPYTFAVSEEIVKSLTGALPPTPAPPTCIHQTTH